MPIWKLVGGSARSTSWAKRVEIPEQTCLWSGQSVEERYGRNWDETECSGRTPLIVVVLHQGTRIAVELPLLERLPNETDSIPPDSD